MLSKWLKGLLACMVFFITTGQALSQDQSDILRYSRQFFPTNARAAGAANAFGAVGANTLAPTLNPAGLGMYRKSEVNITPALEVANTKSSFLGTNDDNNAPNFSISQFSLVLNSVQTRLGKPKQEGWAAYTFSMGLNRRRGFQRRGLAEGNNTRNSILQGFTKRAEGRFPSNLGTQTIEGLAYQNFLITPFAGEDSTSYFPSTEPGEPDVSQERNFTSEGGVSDLYLSFGANYSNTLYLGVTLGFPIVNYEEEAIFKETNNNLDQANLNDSFPNFRSMEFKRSLKTTGNGFYGGIGAIYRPFDFMRVGVSIFSPTFYSLEDEFEYTMSAEVLDIPGTYNGEVSSPKSTFDYSITTPFRLNTSLAFFLGQRGFLSIDYQYQNHRNGQISSDNFSFSEVNNLVGDLYEPTHQLRIGSEVRLGTFSLRGGYGFFSSPFQENITSFKRDGRGFLYSAGFGVHLNSFTIDLAFQSKTLHRFVEPYSVSGDNPQIQERIRRSHIMLTGTYQW